MKTSVSLPSQRWNVISDQAPRTAVRVLPCAELVIGTWRREANQRNGDLLVYYSANKGRLGYIISSRERERATVYLNPQSFLLDIRVREFHEGSGARVKESKNMLSMASLAQSACASALRSSLRSPSICAYVLHVHM